jgi:thiol-disulfide isomerase/thioredoxin
MEKDGLPDFSSMDINGEKVVFNNNFNKLKIVNFWASWCEPCIAEVPSLIELVKSFPDQIEVFAISGDNSIDDVNAFLKAFPGMKNKNIHIILDQQQKIMNLYGTDRLPESFISDKKGRLVKKVIGSINWHTKESESFVQGILNR